MTSPIETIVANLGSDAAAALVANTSRLSALGASLGIGEIDPDDVVACPAIAEAVILDREWTDAEGIDQLRANPSIAARLKAKEVEDAKAQVASAAKAERDRHNAAMAQMNFAEKISYARRHNIAFPAKAANQNADATKATSTARTPWERVSAYRAAGGTK